MFSDPYSLFIGRAGRSEHGKLEGTDQVKLDAVTNEFKSRNSMFPSIGQVPMGLLDGWMHAVARVNPVTNLLRMTRQGFLGDVTWEQTWPGLLVLVIGFTVFMGLASAELRKSVP